MSPRWCSGGGELELEGNYMGRVADAVRLMATHCEGDFYVVNDATEEGFSETPGPEQTNVEFVCERAPAARRVANLD